MSVEMIESAVECGVCHAPNDLDAQYCDQCGWGFQPVKRGMRNILLAAAFIAVFAAGGVLRGTFALYGGWMSDHERKAELKPLYDQARRYALSYELAAKLGGKALAGTPVFWDIVPEGPGKAFYRGDWHEPLRITVPWEGDSFPGGKSSVSVKVLASLEDDGRPGVALKVLRRY